MIEAGTHLVSSLSQVVEGKERERGLEGWRRRRWDFHLGEGGFFCLNFFFCGGVVGV